MYDIHGKCHFFPSGTLLSLFNSPPWWSCTKHLLAFSVYLGFGNLLTSLPPLEAHLPPFPSCSSSRRVPILVPNAWWPTPGWKVPLLGHKDPVSGCKVPMLGCSYPQPLQHSGAVTSSPTCSYQHAPECWLQEKEHVSLIVKPQKLAPPGLWGKGRGDTQQRRRGKIHNEVQQQPKKAGKAKVQQRRLTQERRCKFFILKWNLIQNKVYPEHFTYPWDIRMCPVQITLLERCTALCTDLVLVWCRSLEMQAVSCPTNGNGKATRFHWMIFIIFKMCTIHRATVHKSTNFNNIF